MVFYHPLRTSPLKGEDSKKRASRGGFDKDCVFFKEWEINGTGRPMVDTPVNDSKKHRWTLTRPVMTKGQDQRMAIK